MAKEIINNFILEFKLDWRNKTMLLSNVFFIFLTVIVIHFSFNRLSIDNWNALYWIIVLFSSISIMTKSFLNNSISQKLYYYTISSGRNIWIARWLYHGFLLFVIAILTYIIMVFFKKDPVEDHLLFFVTCFIGSSLFSMILSLISAIVSHTNKSGALMATFGMPLLIPVIIILVELSLNSMIGISFQASLKSLGSLLLLQILLFIIGYILFPNLWQE